MTPITQARSAGSTSATFTQTRTCSGPTCSDRRLRIDATPSTSAMADRSAEAEKHQADDEGPEVALSTPSERVLLRRCSRCPLGTKQEKRLISRVSGGLKGLGQHRRRPCENEPDQLRDGNGEVGSQCDEHRSSPRHDCPRSSSSARPLTLNSTTAWATVGPYVRRRVGR